MNIMLTVKKYVQTTTSPIPNYFEGKTKNNRHDNSKELGNKRFYLVNYDVDNLQTIGKVVNNYVPLTT